MKTVTEPIEKFIIFCLECYKCDSGMEGAEALKVFEDYEVFTYLTDGFEVLHTQGRDYIVADIKEYIANTISQ